MIRFVVKMACPGWQRPREDRRRGKGSFFVDNKTAAAKSEIGFAARAAMRGEKIMTEPVHLHVTAKYVPPRSWPKWKRQYLADHRIGCPVKPDADNVLKLVCDACNGIVWLDDQQVTSVEVHKIYSHEPELIVVASELMPIPQLMEDLP